MRFSEWTPEEPGRILDLRPPGAVLDLIRYYGGDVPPIVDEVFGQAYTHRAQTAVIEYRYVDPDYRSEHSQFYSKTFRRYPSVAHRIHFFQDPPPDGWEGQDELPLDFSDMAAGYLGYTVLRPLAGARVGRTVIAPPSQIREQVTCFARDHVNVFGVPMSVLAAPFMAQDAQLGVCAHMSLWTTAYFHHLAYGTPRFTAAQVGEVVPTDLGVGRSAPSTGLTVHQLAAGCRGLGLPALVYRCREPGDLPVGESIPTVCCRYLNSGMPVIVAAGRKHAFVLVGYERVDQGTENERIHFIRQDDEAGPYGVVEDFAHDKYGPWEYLIVPLPAKLFLPGEVAESMGQERILEALRSSSDEQILEDYAKATQSGMGREISFRSTAIRSNRFKETLSERGFEPDAVAAYRRMQLPRWIWVVEAIRRSERADHVPAVLAESIIDATDHGRDPHALAWRAAGVLWSWLPDEDKVGFRTLAPMGLVDSVARWVGDEPLAVQPG